MSVDKPPPQDTRGSQAASAQCDGQPSVSLEQSPRQEFGVSQTPRRQPALDQLPLPHDKPGPQVDRTPLHVAVLMGGWSCERSISLSSGDAVSKALEDLGHRVTRIDMAHDVAAVLVATKPDVVFNALHGGEGENGAIQGVMDIMGIRYTHSGVRASVIAMDKVLTKKVLALEGIQMPPGCVVRSEDLYVSDPLPRPYVLKPVNEGSSIGVVVVTEDGPYPQPIARGSAGPWAQFDRLLAEPYIPGRELTVGVLGHRAMQVTELVPKNHSPVFDFKSKYTAGAARHVCPADLPREITKACCDWAERAHKALECSGATRMDFRWDDSKGLAGLFLLEVNTQPGMTPTSLFHEQAACLKMNYAQCVQAILDETMSKARPRTHA
ncbi:hypothetical protein HDU86_001952 [Geranomyces michiganensis]|nr:hypothetical protein HDU86_001952 [Geranomyces michiganensis]